MKLNKEDRIKIQTRFKVMEYIKKQLDNISVGDFYDNEEYELTRAEYEKMAEMIRDLDKVVELKERYKHGLNANVNKYFKER